MSERSRFVFRVALLFALGATSALLGGDEKILTGRGLKTEIFQGIHFERPVLERIDPNLDWYWDYAAPDEGVQPDQFSIRWNGWIRPPRAGRYKFLFAADDAVRLWIDGNKVLDRTLKGELTVECSVELTNKPHPIRVEFFDYSRGAYIAMFWQHASSPRPTIVPPEALFLDEASALAKPGEIAATKSGLAVDYYDVGFQRTLDSAVVPRAEAIWGQGGPTLDLPADLSARYYGVLLPPATGKSKLSCYSDGMVRVWIDNKLLLDKKAGQQRVEAPLDLVKNTPVAIRIDFTNKTGWGSYYLHWTPPNAKHELPIPPERLFQTRTAALESLDER